MFSDFMMLATGHVEVHPKIKSPKSNYISCPKIRQVLVQVPYISYVFWISLVRSSLFTGFFHRRRRGPGDFGCDLGGHRGHSGTLHPGGAAATGGPGELRGALPALAVGAGTHGGGKGVV